MLKVFFPSPPSANNIKRRYAIEVHSYAEFQQRVTKTLQLVDSNAAHQVYRYKGCHLMLVVGALPNISNTPLPAHWLAFCVRKVTVISFSYFIFYELKRITNFS